MLPKEVTVDHNPARELDDSELDSLIQAMRQRVLEAREEKALDQAAQVKLVEHVRS
jgi:hypothetical protein